MADLLKIRLKPDVVNSDYYSDAYDYGSNLDLEDFYGYYHKILSEDSAGNHLSAFNQFIDSIIETFTDTFIESDDDEHLEAVFDTKNNANKVYLVENICGGIVDSVQSEVTDYLENLQEPFSFNFSEYLRFHMIFSSALEVYDGDIEPAQQKLINAVSSHFIAADSNTMYVGDNQIALRLYLMGNKLNNPRLYKNMLRVVEPAQKGKQTNYVLPKHWAQDAFDNLSDYLWSDYNKRFKGKTKITDKIKKFYLSLLEFTRKMSQTSMGYSYNPDNVDDSWNRWKDFRTNLLTRRKKRVKK